MDIKQYITSGILELYVLDRLEPAAMREVEAVAAQYPEVRAELEQIELTLEGFAMAPAQTVNPDILDRLLDETRSAPASEPPIEQPSNAPVGKIGQGMLASVLPWVVAIGAILGLLYLYNQVGKQDSQLSDLQSRYEKLEKDCDESQEILRSTQEFVNELTKPSTQGVILASTDDTSDRSAIVFYNQITGKTLFKATNLPPPPTGKQYQLWAIDAGGAKDLGVLATGLSGDVILEVDHFSAVATFAITLEDAGGKPAPDLTQIQVAGNVS